MTFRQQDGGENSRAQPGVASSAHRRERRRDGGDQHARDGYREFVNHVILLSEGSFRRGGITFFPFAPVHF
ncbi:MAG: hypothetical protein GMKNLPBB_02162 [Myxococcota bacterium]|nr:hypothetical protein [Myxococcota bacterium]